MAVKLTTYDPAEDLASDEAMATFIAEAFATEARVMSHMPWGSPPGPRAWRRWPRGRRFAGASLSVAERAGQSDIDDDDRGDEGVGDRVDD
jgi:hypothetical protein